MDPRNLYFSDVNKNIIYNEYKPAIMPSQSQQQPKKIKIEYVYLDIAARSIIILYNINK